MTGIYIERPAGGIIVDKIYLETIRLMEGGVNKNNISVYIRSDICDLITNAVTVEPTRIQTEIFGIAAFRVDNINHPDYVVVATPT
jgi:hypothetical protein